MVWNSLIYCQVYPFYSGSALVRIQPEENHKGKQFSLHRLGPKQLGIYFGLGFLARALLLGPEGSSDDSLRLLPITGPVLLGQPGADHPDVAPGVQLPAPSTHSGCSFPTILTVLSILIHPLDPTHRNWHSLTSVTVPRDRYGPNRCLLTHQLHSFLHIHNSPNLGSTPPAPPIQPPEWSPKSNHIGHQSVPAAKDSSTVAAKPTAS